MHVVVNDSHYLWESFFLSTFAVEFRIRLGQIRPKLHNPDPEDSAVMEKKQFFFMANKLDAARQYVHENYNGGNDFRWDELSRKLQIKAPSDSAWQDVDTRKINSIAKISRLKFSPFIPNALCQPVHDSRDP